MPRADDKQQFIVIGGFTLSRTLAGGIWIERASPEAYAGEGGSFDEAALEAVIRAFYNEHF